jgi:nudix-type nucleoside diphosphatase (YffH/AdpP family)
MRLFLYGTLLHEPLFARIAGPGEGGTVTRARLDGHAVDRVDGSELPMIVKRAGARAEGVVRDGLTAAQRARLDLYEVAFGYSVEAVTVETGEGAGPALAYFPPSGQVSAGEAWSLARWRARDGEMAVYAAEELDAHEPRLSGPEMVRQWPMIAARARARVRAGQAVQVTRLRHVPGAGDWGWVPAAPLAGGFFKLASMTMEHARFDGGREAGLRREVLVGVDAALLLPYDPVRDRVLLIEQFRTGPARRGDSNPWTLEPIAGIVDANEEPEEAARREAEEEAGLAIAGVERMFSFYPSPGSNTDHFYCYLGLCDLPDGHATHGGLESEAEDIRLHVMSRDEALALAESGEVTAGPLITMLYWLDRQQARIRAEAGRVP